MGGFVFFITFLIVFIILNPRRVGEWAAKVGDAYKTGRKTLIQPRNSDGDAN